MTKETRANLVFLAVFLAISLPGGVILFMKKLDPKAPSMYMPDTVRRSLPYNSPEEAPDLKRFVPEQTGKWVEGVAKEHGYSSVLRRGGLPVMSERRRWQLVGVKRSDSSTEAGLLLWDDAMPAEGSFDVSETGAGRVEVREAIAIPESVRKELVFGGYPKPPKGATWVSVALPAGVGPGAVLHLPSAGSGTGAGDSVKLFTE